MRIQDFMDELHDRIAKIENENNKENDQEKLKMRGSHDSKRSDKISETSEPVGITQRGQTDSY